VVSIDNELCAGVFKTIHSLLIVIRTVYEWVPFFNGWVLN